MLDHLLLEARVFQAIVTNHLYDEAIFLALFVRRLKDHKLLADLGRCFTRMVHEYDVVAFDRCDLHLLEPPAKRSEDPCEACCRLWNQIIELVGLRLKLNYVRTGEIAVSMCPHENIGITATHHQTAV